MAFIALTLALILSGDPPHAVVIGESAAADCFTAARSNVVTHGDVETCRRAVQDVRLREGDRAASFVNYGIVLRRRGQLNEAILAYDRAVDLAPDLAEAFLNRGAAWAALADTDLALADLDRALALGPAEPQVALVNRALVYERRGELDAAWRDLQAALAITPDYPPALQALERYQVRAAGEGR